MFHCLLNDIPSLYLDEKMDYSTTSYNIIIRQISHLIFDNGFNCTIGPKLMLSTITHLSFGKKYNKPIRLTRYLLYIKFGDGFNSRFDTPRQIVYLTFGYSFNKPLKPTHKLKYLKLAHCFSQPVETSKNMHTLIFDMYYNCNIPIPKSLKHLSLGIGVTSKIILPSNMKYLDMGYGNNPHSNLERLSQNTHIIIRTNYPKINENLPNNIKHVHFSLTRDPKPYGYVLPNHKTKQFGHIMKEFHMDNLPNSIMKKVVSGYKNKNHDMLGKQFL